MSSNKLEIVRSMYQAFGTGDMDSFFSHLTDNVEWESRYVPNVPFHGVYAGRDGILRLFGMLESLVELHTFVPEKMLGDDQTVVSLGHEELTVKATGVRYRNNWIHVFSFDGDKVSHVQSSNDTAAAQTAFNP